MSWQIAMIGYAVGGLPHLIWILLVLFIRNNEHRIRTNWTSCTNKDFLVPWCCFDRLPVHNQLTFSAQIQLPSGVTAMRS